MRERGKEPEKESQRKRERARERWKQERKRPNPPPPPRIKSELHRPPPTQPNGERRSRSQTVNAVRLTAHRQTKRSKDNAVRVPNRTEPNPSQRLT
eukprot:scaffold633124_cov63-Attheya_sp.AAC.3